MSARPIGRLDLHQRRRMPSALRAGFVLPRQIVKGGHLVEQIAHIIGAVPMLTTDRKYIMLFASGQAGNLPPLASVFSPDNVSAFHNHFVFLSRPVAYLVFVACSFVIIEDIRLYVKGFLL